MSNVFVMEHPLIQHKIGIMRKKTTSTKEFRDLVSEVAGLIYYEASRNLPLADKVIETPLVTTTVKEIAGKKLCVVPILRAGLHMADGILNLTPNAKVVFPAPFKPTTASFSPGCSFRLRWLTASVVAPL